MAENKRSIELKRVVMVKAIVTEAIKEKLTTELERPIADMENQTTQVAARSK